MSILANGLFELDGATHNTVITIPSTHKPGECGPFTLILASDVELKIDEMGSLPKAPEEEKKKKKKKSKKEK